MVVGTYSKWTGTYLWDTLVNQVWDLIRTTCFLHQYVAVCSPMGFDPLENVFNFQLKCTATYSRCS
jgi:hypothetical protein